MLKLLFYLLVSLAWIPAAALARDIGWPAYGNGPGGSRYSTLAQIDAGNVQKLKVAWTFRTGDLGKNFLDWDRTSFEATPVLYQGVLYLPTSETNVVAVDAATGKLRWRFDSHTRGDLHYSDTGARGVAVWVDKQAAPKSPCRVRVFAPTLDSRLLALDADTGKLCKGFGHDGVINLLEGVRSTSGPHDKWRNYLVTSPPVVLDGRLIVGSSVGDNRGVELESGVVRAYDARSGKLQWAWDPIPRDPSNPVYRQWRETDARYTGAANAWGPLSVDLKRHLVFVPTGSASPDFYGGQRAGPDRWADSVVALDGASGTLVWGRQLVHHDLWDYDSASQPTLVSLMHDGHKVPAVIQANKAGFLYTFNRVTGEPVFPIHEKYVPHDAVPGETPSPTQPVPVAPPALARQSPVTPDDAFGIAWFDTRECRARIKKYRSEGIFQPPTTKVSIMMPGSAGGVEWGGLAFDPKHQVAVVNTMNLPFLVALVPRDQMDSELRSGRYRSWEFGRQRGTPYGMRRALFVSRLGIPCTRPPWGQLAAVDMVHGRILWQVPLGDTPFIHFNVGVPNMGGPIITGSGLVFIGATMDDDFRAFDLKTGKVLWQVKLPAGGQATPMTYSIKGRQYVVIAAGGHGKMGTTRGDYLVAYALPHPLP